MASRIHPVGVISPEDRGSSSLTDPVCFSKTPSSSSPRGAETWKCRIQCQWWPSPEWSLAGLCLIWAGMPSLAHELVFTQCCSWVIPGQNFRAALFSSVYYSVCVLGECLPMHFSMAGLLWAVLSLSHVGVSPRSMPRMETPTLIKSSHSLSGDVETILFLPTMYKDFHWSIFLWSKFWLMGVNCILLI